MKILTSKGQAPRDEPQARGAATPSIRMTSLRDTPCV